MEKGKEEDENLGGGRGGGDVEGNSVIRRDGEGKR